MKTFLFNLWVTLKTISITTLIVIFTYLFNFFFVTLAVGFAHYMAVPLLLKMGIPAEIAWLAVMLTFIRIHFSRLMESDMVQKRMLKRLILSDRMEIIQDNVEDADESK